MKCSNQIGPRIDDLPPEPVSLDHPGESEVTENVPSNSAGLCCLVFGQRNAASRPIQEFTRFRKNLLY
jgi:hypothetical protein